MTIEELKELKKGLMNMLFICLSKLTDKDARETVKADTAQIILAIDAEIARQSVTGEEIEKAIEWISNYKEMLETFIRGNNPLVTGDERDRKALCITILTALHQYRQPANQFEKWKAGLTMKDAAVMLDGMADCYSCPAYRRCSEHFGERCQDAFVKWGEQRA